MDTRQGEAQIQSPRADPDQYSEIPFTPRLPVKAFKDSTPLGSWVSLKGAAFDLQSLRLHLTVNGKTRQDGSTADMLFKV